MYGIQGKRLPDLVDETNLIPVLNWFTRMYLQKF
jgi:hypothetical protein